MELLSSEFSSRRDGHYEVTGSLEGEGYRDEAKTRRSSLQIQV